MTGRDFWGAVISGVLVVGVFSAVITTPPIDDAANEKAVLAEAKMKVRILTKWPDPQLASMSMPLAPAAKDANK